MKENNMKPFTEDEILKINKKLSEKEFEDKNNLSDSLINSGMSQRLFLAGMITAGVAVNVGRNGFTLPNPLKDIAEFSLMLADELIEQNNKVEEKI